MDTFRRAVLSFTLIALAGTFPTSLLAAQQSVDHAPSAEQRLGGWLTAFDGNNKEAYREFLQQNFPSGVERAAQDWGLRENTGGFDLKEIEEKTQTEITAVLQERGGDYFARIVLEIEPTEPYHILSLQIRPIERPAGFPLPHLSEKELITALRERLKETVANDRSSGAVLFAKDGKAVFEQAYGLADREHNIPNTLETRFSIASMNKMFTAVATMQLVQSGRLKLDDSLSKYLTNYPNKELAAKVTIGQLLTNTGGTGDIWGPEFDQHHQELQTFQDYIRIYGSRALRFEPGSRWEYSNYGFILLDAIIEKVSGERYDDYVREHIFIPEGMASTGSESEHQTTIHRSIGYTRMGTDTWHPATHIVVPGTTYSTVEDFLKFANALRENKLLNATFTKLLTTPQVKNSFGFSDAYGFGVQTINGTPCFGHNGGSIGVNGDLELCGSSYTVISLANMDPPAAQRISDFIINRLPMQ